MSSQKNRQIIGIIQEASKVFKRRILVGIPITGLLRAEWVLARYGQITPCNWSQVDCLHWLDQYSPLGYMVADARNVIATKFVESQCDWLLFIDHDTIIPRDFILKANERMLKGDVPVWSGLYFTKSVPSEPLIYRGRGNSYYTDWKMGDKVWVDGIPMGCTMIHRSILKVMYDESPEYQMGTARARKIFEPPAKVYEDPQTKAWFTSTGTEDLYWCDRLKKENVFEKAGWKKYAKMKYPLLVDTSIFCWHIEFDGIKYPSKGEERYFMRKK